MTFKKSERRILIFLLSTAFIIHLYAIKLKPKSNSKNIYKNLDSALVELSKSEEAIIGLKHADNKYQKSYSNKEVSKWPEKKPSNSQGTIEQKRQLFPFDPNSIDSSTWIKLGLKPWVVTNILKYRNKGGLFKNAESLQKIYGLNKTTYTLIKPYCIIDTSIFAERKRPYVKSKKINPQVININLADTTELKSLYGIGSKLASRIIKYRSNIGGFHKIEQILEVYGINPEVIENNRGQLSVSGPLKKIDINSISKDSLSKHFYFDFKSANAIHNYRYQHGKFKSFESLSEIKSLSEETLKKIEPYLEYN